MKAFCQGKFRYFFGGVTRWRGNGPFCLEIRKQNRGTKWGHFPSKEGSKGPGTGRKSGKTAKKPEKNFQNEMQTKMGHTGRNLPISIEIILIYAEKTAESLVPQRKFKIKNFKKLLIFPPGGDIM